MKDLNDIIKDDKAFEKLLINVMHKVGREQDQEIIDEISNMSEEEFRKLIRTRTAHVPNPILRIVRYAAAACVAVFVVIGGLQYNASYQTMHIGDSYYTQISSDMSYMKSDISTKEFDNLEILFANVAEGKDLKVTIKELEEAYKQSADEVSTYNYIRNTIAWNLAMAYLKDGDRKAAEPILEDIIQNPDNEDKAIQKKAQEALDDIDSIFSLW